MKHPQHKAPQPLAKPTFSQTHHALLTHLLHWAQRFLVPIVMIVTLCLQLPLLLKLGERALCYADAEGFMEALTRPLPGGGLQWCADFLAVLFHQPWLGSLAFLLLGAGVFAIGRYWAKLHPLIAALPLLQVLLQLTYCGFSVWIFGNASFAQGYLLAWATTLFVLGAIKRYGAWGLLTSLLYPFAGISVLVGLLFGALLRQTAWVTRLFCIAIALGWVIGWKLCCYADPSWLNLLSTQHWMLFEPESWIWDAISIATLLALACADLLTPTVGHVTQRFPWLKPLWAPLTAGCFILGVVLAFDPTTLYSILRCERNLRRGDGQAALQLPEAEIVGHRMLSAYHIHGLWRAGKLEDKLFDMPWTVSHKASTIDTMSLDGHWLLYHYGIVQLARRWCYESVIKLGWNGEHYALLTKIAIVCNEMSLAKRYALQLARIPLRGREAAEYLAYIDGAPIPKDHELWRIADLHLRLSADAGSPTFEAGKKLEEGIYNRYAVLKNGSKEMVTLYLCSSLLLQDTTALVENLDVILRVWPQRPLPRVFQQGLLAAAAQLPPDKQPRLTADLFTPGMFEAFQAFQKEAPTADPAAAQFRKRFGRSYWYYAAFLQ